MDPIERDAIDRVVRTYLSSWYAGDHAAMARCLHHGLVKRRLVSEREGGPRYLNHLQRDEMVAATEAGLGVGRARPDLAFEVDVLHIDGDIASARAASHEWIDHLHLLREDGAWRIVQCLYVPAR